MNQPNAIKLFSLFIMVLLYGCSSPESKETWTTLFNGKDLKGWDTYVGPKYSTEKGDFDGDPAGLNNDPDKVFTVVELDGESVIRVSGEHFGGISTVDSYENYHLQLQFKWGENKYAPRDGDNDKRDSGLLYHARGPHAADWFFWMKSQEFQIQEGDCGDYWGLGSEVEITATMNADSTYTYDAGAELLPFGQQSTLNRNVKKSIDGEKPTGEWNTIELYCLAGTSYHVVNGKLTMILTNSREIVDGIGNPITAGKLQIQSEGAELFYKNIKIRTIEELPLL